MDFLLLGIWGLAFLYVFYKVYRSIRIISTQDVLIVERLGKYSRSLRAGFHIMIPFVDRDAYYHSLKEQSIDVAPQICITKDNVQVKVDGVLYMRVIDPYKASYGIEDYRFAVIQLAQTTMRAVIGMMELDKTFEERDFINSKIVQAIDEVSEAWGIKVNRYEIINIQPPASVLDAMEKEKKAQINKKAQISLSEGDRDSRINRSQAIKEEMINKSQGEMQRQINQAEGKAKEIESIAEATAKGLEFISSAINAKGGSEAVKLQIAQKFVRQLTEVAKKDTDLVLPADLTDLNGLLDQIINRK